MKSNQEYKVMKYFSATLYHNVRWNDKTKFGIIKLSKKNQPQKS